MLPFRCAALGLAAAGLLLLAAPAARAEPAAGDWREARTLPDLVETLNLWLDAHSPWPRRDAPVDVLMNAPIPPGSDMARASRAGAVPRGLYDPDRREIRLLRPWSPARVQDVSVLLHELAHHRQQHAQHWYCPGQQEESAYRLQEQWLAEQGAEIAINWIAVVLESGCTKRDIHPD
ncbi:MAG: DUF6647 family protein [Pseudooceanicola sp.]